MGKAFLALLLVSSAALAATPGGGGHGGGGGGGPSAGAGHAGISGGAATAHGTGTHIQSIKTGATTDKPKPKPRPVVKIQAPAPNVEHVVPTMVLPNCTPERRLRHECGEAFPLH